MKTEYYFTIFKNFHISFRSEKFDGCCTLVLETSYDFNHEFPKRYDTNQLNNFINELGIENASIISMFGTEQSYADWSDAQLKAHEPIRISDNARLLNRKIHSTPLHELYSFLREQNFSVADSLSSCALRFLSCGLYSPKFKDWTNEPKMEAITDGFSPKVILASSVVIAATAVFGAIAISNPDKASNFIDFASSQVNKIDLSFGSF